MNHFKWLNQSHTIMIDIHKSLYDNIETCDISLMAGGRSVKAHRFVLAACSTFLRKLLLDVPFGCECIISLPDVHGTILENVITFIYLGEVHINSVILQDFLQIINILGIKSAISFQCNVTSIASLLALSVDNSLISVNTKDIGNLGMVTSSESLTNQAGIITTMPVENIHKITTEAVVATMTSTVPVDTDLKGNMHFLDIYEEQQQQQSFPESIRYSIEKNTDSLSQTAANIINTNQYLIPGQSGPYQLNINNDHNDGDVDLDTRVDVVIDPNNIIEEYNDTSDGHRKRIIIINDPQANNLTNSDEIVPGHYEMNSIHQISNINIELNNHQNIGTNDEADNCDLYTATEIVNNSETTINGNVNLSAYENNPEIKWSGELENELSATDLAYQSIINEGLTLPKAAHKFKVSKSMLWKKVRNAGLKKYVEATLKQPAKFEQNIALEAACKAVVTEGLSLQKAAIKYDVSKTVLWRRVNKHPDYMKVHKENPVVSRAIERLKTGEPLKSISRDLDIPMSTLHRYKVRLLLSGDLPETVTCRRRDKVAKMNFQENLEKAVHACIYNGTSQNHAANKYTISKSTLWRHLQKRVAAAEAAEAAKNTTTSSNSTTEFSDQLHDSSDDMSDEFEDDPQENEVQVGMVGNDEARTEDCGIYM